MRTHELKAWLLGSPEQAISATQIGALLGVEPDAITRASRRSLPFVLAVLRDTYVDELEVWLWFIRPRRELGGARPGDLLLAGRMAELEALVVHQWNQHATGRERAGIMLGARTSSAAAL